MEKVFSLIFDEIRNLREEGISQKVLDKTKEQIISNFIIGSESTVNRMTSNGGGILLKDNILTIEEVIEKIEAVTLNDMRNIISELFDYSKMSISAVGRIEKADIEKIVNSI